MKLTDTIDSVLKSKDKNRVLSVQPGQSVYGQWQRRIAIQLNLICGFNEPHRCHYPSLIAQWRIPFCARSPLFHASL
jgi:hypothetical protein